MLAKPVSGESWLLPVSSQGLSWAPAHGERTQVSSSHKGSDPMWGPSLTTSIKPHYLPKASPPNTNVLGIKASTYDLGGGGGETTNIQSMT